MKDSHDPDGLSEFGTELGGETRRVKTRTAESAARKSRRARLSASTSVRKAAIAARPATIGPEKDEENEDDWLSVFITEPRLDVMPRARDAALESPDDDLNQFAPDAHVNHASDDEDQCLDQFPEQQAVAQQPPAAIIHAQAQTQPWAGPWAAAVVAVVVCVLLGTRSLHPAWWNAGLRDTRPSATSESLNAASSPSLSPAPQFVTPAVKSGISSRTLRRSGAVPIRVPQLAMAIVRPDRNVSGMGSTPTRLSTPPPSRSSDTRRVAERASNASPGESTLLAPRADRILAVETVPLARVAAPGRAGEDFLAATQRTPLRPDAALASFTTPKASEVVATQEHAVRRALHSYETAYENLDVAATAAVWPSVDRRALARAFDTLKSQGLDFQNCAISVGDSTATARCRGTLQIIRKVGNSVPLTAEQEWVFKMRRLGADWMIDDVAASRASGVAAQRTRSQG